MRTTDPKDYDAEDDLTMDECADGHPMRAVILDGKGGIFCSACGSTGREADATSHPGGELCRRTGCHPLCENCADGFHGDCLGYPTGECFCSCPDASQGRANRGAGASTRKGEGASTIGPGSSIAPAADAVATPASRWRRFWTHRIPSNHRLARGRWWATPRSARFVPVSLNGGSGA